MSTPNPINIAVIDHVVIRARDLDTMISFYRDVLGCRLERGPGKEGLAQLRAGASLIDLVDARGPIGIKDGDPPDGRAPNMDHVCLQVQPWDERLIRQQLEKHGVESGETANRYGAQGMGPSIYLRDPEGNTVELKGAI